MPSASPSGFSTSATMENDRFLMSMIASSGSRTVPGVKLALLPRPGNRPGHRDRWRRLDVLASEPSGCICVAAVVLIALIIFMLPALEAAS